MKSGGSILLLCGLLLAGCTSMSNRSAVIDGTKITYGQLKNDPFSPPRTGFQFSGGVDRNRQIALARRAVAADGKCRLVRMSPAQHRRLQAGLLSPGHPNERYFLFGQIDCDR